MTYSLLYRGFLSSCNYSCGYCPFAKRMESRAQLHRDRQSVERFASWVVEQHSKQWKILFTPWGEALTRSWYRAAITRLSRLPQVQRVSAQTNLSCGVRWINNCNLERFSLWTTFHPSEVSAAAFAAKVMQLREQGVQLSGRPGHAERRRGHARPPAAGRQHVAQCPAAPPTSLYCRRNCTLFPDRPAFSADVAP